MKAISLTLVTVLLLTLGSLIVVPIGSGSDGPGAIRYNPDTGQYLPPADPLAGFDLIREVALIVTFTALVAISVRRSLNQ